jgi:hypothetical protein
MLGLPPKPLPNRALQLLALRDRPLPGRSQGFTVALRLAAADWCRPLKEVGSDARS